MQNFHITIIGSGLVGCVTAIALAQKINHPILLIDSKKNQPLEKLDTLDTRTLALNLASCQYLETLGIWHSLAPLASPIMSIHTSEKNAFGSCLFSATEVEAPYLGQVVEIADLQKKLLEFLKQYSNIIFWNEAQVIEAQELSCEKTQLLLNRDQASSSITTDYLILADGTESSLRTQFGIMTDRYDYQQQAMVAVAQLQQSHHQTAYERFYGESVLAILPLTLNRVGTVLTHNSLETRNLIEMDDQSYLGYIENILGFRLGKMTHIGPRRNYPLQLAIANQFVKNNIILLGNTAHTLSPIGAQGLNLGLAGVKDFVKTFLANEDLKQFNARQLERAARLKKFTNQTMSVFASDNIATRIARRAALIGLDFIPSIKHKFIRQMMGMG